MGRKYHMLGVLVVTLLIIIFNVTTNVEANLMFDGDYEYVIDINNKATITKYNGTAVEIDIPNKLGDYDVVEIDDAVFSDKELTRVTIPDGVEIIGNDAFKGNELTDVIIPNSVTQLGQGVFQNNKLTSVNLSNNIKVIETNLFYGNKLTKVIIPDGVTKIDQMAFYDNELSNINIPNSVINIEMGAFGYNSINEVTLSNNLKIIGENAFATNEITKITFPETLEQIGMFAFGENKLSTIEIPESVNEIGDTAFVYNELTEVTIWNDSLQFPILQINLPDVGELSVSVFDFNQDNPEDLTIIGYDPSTAKTYAEENNHTFKTIVTGPESDYEWTDHGDGTATITEYKGEEKEIDIPETLAGLTVTKIGDRVFYDKGITKVSIPNSIIDIGTQAFQLNELESINIPDIVMSIGAYAFYGNKLKNIKIPDNITMIENSTFQNNELEAVDLPKSLTSIGFDAFSSNKLTNLDIPDSVKTIGNHAFEGNELTHVTIPKNIEHIGNYSFAGNDLIEAIIINDSTIIGIEAFEHQGHDGLKQIIIKGYIPSTAKDYALAHNHTFKTIVTGPESDYEWLDHGDGTATITKYIGNNKKVNIPDTLDGLSVTKIGNNAFKGMKLTEVTIPETVTEIEFNAFMQNELSKVTIPNSVTKIGYQAFYVNYLETVNIPNKLTVIENSTFGNNLLKSVTIPDSVTTIGSNAFFGSQLTNIIIPKNVISIDDGAFENNLLTEVTILNKLVKLENITFTNFYNDTLTIVGYDPSTAKKYADEYGHQFKNIKSSSGGGGSGSRPRPPIEEDPEQPTSPSLDEQIKDINLSLGTDHNIQLHSDETDYITETEEDQFTFSRLDENSDITVTVNGEQVEGTAEFALEEGENVFDIVITTENGEEHQFTITIERLKEVNFTDTETHWANDYIKTAYRNGWFKGHTPDQFGPDNHLTRMQSASLFVRILKLTESADVPFKDIKSIEADIMEELRKAYANGIVGGYEDMTFKPYSNVTRAQFALMIYRTYEKITGTRYTPKGEANFPDISGYDEETRNAIAMLVELGIAEGSDGNFLPNNPASRAHAAKMLVNFKDVLDNR